MNKELYLKQMEQRFPQDYLDYSEAVRIGELGKSVTVLSGMYDRLSGKEKNTAFGTKLGLELAVISFYTGDTAKAKKTGAKCLRLAYKNNDISLVAEAEYVMGFILVRCSQTEAAIHHLKKSLSSAEANNDTALAAWDMMEIAQCAIENYDQLYALEMLFKALRSVKKSKDVLLELHLYYVISTLYNDIDDMDASYKYIEKAITRIKIIKENPQLMSGLSGTIQLMEPQVITRYAFICYRRGNYEEAVKIAADSMNEEVNNPENHHKALFMIASLSLLELGREMEAVEYAELSFREETQYFTRPYNEVMYLTYRLMNLFLSKGRTEDTLKLIKFTEQTVENQKIKANHRLSWRMYAEYYNNIGDTDKKIEALENYMLYMEAYNKEREGQIFRGIRSQIKLDEEAKRRERQKNKQQSKLALLLAEREAAEYMSDHDALTGLFTRNKLNKDRESELLKKMKSCGIVFFDVNDLKLTNDVYGHEVGDIMIKNFAGSLKVFEDERYNSYRIGGDEFILLIRDCEDYELDIAMERWHAEMEKINGEADIKCVVAAGCAFGCENVNIQALIRKADERMYENKRTLKSRQDRTDKLKELSCY